MISLTNESFVSAMAGVVAVIVIFVYAKKKKLRIGEGKKIGINLSAGRKNFGSLFGAVGRADTAATSSTSGT